MQSHWFDKLQRAATDLGGAPDLEHHSPADYRQSVTAAGRKAVDDSRRFLQAHSKRVLGAVGLVTPEDVARLERRLELLEKRLRRTLIRLEILNRK